MTDFTATIVEGVSPEMSAEQQRLVAAAAAFDVSAATSATAAAVFVASAILAQLSGVTGAGQLAGINVSAVMGAIASASTLANAERIAAGVLAGNASALVEARALRLADADLASTADAGALARSIVNAAGEMTAAADAGVAPSAVRQAIAVMAANAAFQFRSAGFAFDVSGTFDASPSVSAIAVNGGPVVIGGSANLGGFAGVASTARGDYQVLIGLDLSASTAATAAMITSADGSFDFEAAMTPQIQAQMQAFAVMGAAAMQSANASAAFQVIGELAAALDLTGGGGRLFEVMAELGASLSVVASAVSTEAAFEPNASRTITIDASGRTLIIKIVNL